MVVWTEQEFFDYMRQDSWFTSDAIAAAQGIMNWARQNPRVRASWTGKKVPMFVASADSKQFIAVMTKKGWDLEIPFRHESWGYLLERSKNQQVIARLELMGIKTVKQNPLSPDHRRAILLASVNSCLEEFLELMDWIVEEIYQERKLL